MPPPYTHTRKHKRPQEEEEVDELALLWDEELATMDPDALPRRLITDFSVYNAEVRAAAGPAACCLALVFAVVQPLACALLGQPPCACAAGCDL